MADQAGPDFAAAAKAVESLAEDTQARGPHHDDWRAYDTLRVTLLAAEKLVGEQRQEIARLREQVSRTALAHLKEAFGD